MYKTKKYFYTLVLILFVLFYFAQNQTTKWHFGLNAGLDFSTNPPTILSNSSFTSSEGGASISDVTGNLLFYTNANIIWNQLNIPMANGTGLLGNQSTTQSSIIIKQPGNSNIYFVFTQDAQSLPNGLRYSVVDMNLAAGMGSVTIKNILLQTPSTERLAAIKHCNGIDFWIVTHDMNSNVFRNFLFTSTGINPIPVLSSVGTVISGNGFIGAIKISPNGKKLGMSVFLNGTGNCQLFDFDNSSGYVINPIMLNNNIIDPYGIEFSPNSTKLYCANFSSNWQIFQWNVCAGSNASIISSQFVMPTNMITCGSLQLAANGKIYVSFTNKQTLGIINYPNLSGAACSYTNAGQSIGTATSQLGLPNFMSSYFNAIQQPITYSFTNNCSIVNFSVPTICEAVSNYTSFIWNFDDPASGSNNTSLLSPISHSFSSIGTYTVKLILYSLCGSDTMNQVINVGTPIINITGNSTICNGQTANLTASGANTYTWSQGTNTSTINVSPSVNTIYSVTGSVTNGCTNTATILVNITTIGTPIINIVGNNNICVGSPLTLTANGANTYTWNTGINTNTLNSIPLTNTTYTAYGSATTGCINQQTIAITVNPLPSITTSGNNIICIGSSVTQTANGAITYTWSTGENTTTVNLTPTITGTYTVYGTNISGCTNQQTVSVIVNPLPIITTSGNNSICIGSTVTEMAFGANTYTWSTGENINVVSFTPSVNTVYSVSGSDINGCINTTTVLITVNLNIPITGFSYHQVCQNEINIAPTTVNGFNSGGMFLSNNLNIDANTGQVNLNLTNAGTYPVTYSVLINGCIGSNTTNLMILPAANLNLNPSTSITPGSSTILNVSGGITYTWNPVNYLGCINCDNPIASPPENIKYCVSSEMNSCISRACIDIIVTCETNNDYSVPNAFTPNGDGNNDAFCLQGWNNCLSSFNVMIFERWGEKVFESSNPNFCWDGIYNGKLLDAAVFIYVINATGFNKNKISKKGNITLIR